MTPQDRAARARLIRWREQPETMVREEFHAEPDAWQLEALGLFAQPSTTRLAFKACKGPGKTAVLAWLVLNFLATRSYCRIGATSITEANLSAGLWPELAKWQATSEFFRTAFAWSKTQLVNRENPETWFCQARTWPKSGNPEEQSNALAGLHADNVMFVLDESGGIPQAVMVTAEAILSSCKEGKVVQAGNPTHTTGPLYRACTIDRPLWQVVTITGDPARADRSPRISLEWANQQIASYGRDNPWVMVNVLGEFPPSSINSLLGVEEVNAAMARHLPADVYSWAQKRLGVDVARFGDDRTILFPRQGLASFRPVEMRNARTTEIAARVQKSAIQWGAELVLIDDTGHWGHGVIDQLSVSAGALRVVGINYAGKAIDPRFKNRRAEFWFKMSEAVKRGAALPPLPEMVPELTEPTYTFNQGQLQIEDKDQIKLRLGRSPDLADAYAQTYALEDEPAGLRAQLQQSHTTVHDFDPYAQPNRDQTRDPYDPYA